MPNTRVLIIEDEGPWQEILIELFQEALGRTSVEIQTVMTGSQAMGKLKREGPWDLVSVDILLGKGLRAEGMDGRDLLEYLGEAIHLKKTGVIACSSLHFDDDIHARVQGKDKVTEFESLLRALFGKQNRYEYFKKPDSATPVEDFKKAFFTNEVEKRIRILARAEAHQPDPILPPYKVTVSGGFAPEEIDKATVFVEHFGPGRSRYAEITNPGDKALLHMLVFFRAAFELRDRKHEKLDFWELLELLELTRRDASPEPLLQLLQQSLQRKARLGKIDKEKKQEAVKTANTQWYSMKRRMQTQHSLVFDELIHWGVRKNGVVLAPDVRVAHANDLFKKVEKKRSEGDAYEVENILLGVGWDYHNRWDPETEITVDEATGVDTVEPDIRLDRSLLESPTWDEVSDSFRHCPLCAGELWTEGQSDWKFCPSCGAASLRPKGGSGLTVFCEACGWNEEWDPGEISLTDYLDEDHKLEGFDIRKSP